MSKIKKSEAISVEREKEIQQVSVLQLFVLFIVNFFIHIQSQALSLSPSVSYTGCWIRKRAGPDNEGSFCTCDRPGTTLFNCYLASKSLTLVQYNKIWDQNLLWQGTIVDRIDYNIQNVASTVEDGLKQLQKVNHFMTWVYTISLSMIHNVQWNRFVKLHRRNVHRGVEVWWCVRLFLSSSASSW